MRQRERANEAEAREDEYRAMWLAEKARADEAEARAEAAERAAFVPFWCTTCGRNPDRDGHHWACAKGAEA